jgi:hypothetical protein
MLQKDYDLVILGAGHIATALIVQCQDLKVGVLSRNASHIEKYGVDVVNWTAGVDKCPKGISAKSVVNCIMPRSKREARGAIDVGNAILAGSGSYVHISSIAVQAVHSNYPKLLRFAGDGYIRTKKFELKYLEKFFPDAQLVYPGIVCGENTVWTQTLRRLNGAKKIIAGGDLNMPAPIVDVDNVAGVLLDCVTQSKESKLIFVPDKRSYGEFLWRDVIGDNKSIIEKGYIFSQSTLKELIITFLTSSLTPDFVWDFVSKVTAKKGNDAHKDEGFEDPTNVEISAMTNFYMTCDYS